MNGPLPKVLLPLFNRPLVGYVLEALKPLAPDKIIVVVGPAADEVGRAVAAPGVECVLQPEPRGTAHAVMVSIDRVTPSEREVMVLCGDVPLISTRTLGALARKFSDERAQVALVTAVVPDPRGYGRIVRNGNGDVVAIVEERDADPALRSINEINAGIYLFETGALRQALGAVTASPVTGELYLTDTVKSIADRGRAVGYVTDAPEEIMGVNTTEELARVEAILAQRSERTSGQGRTSLGDG